MMELLITVGVVLLMGLLVIRIYLVSYNSYRQSTAQAEAQIAARQALMKLAPILERSTPVFDTPTGPQDAFVFPFVGGSGQELHFWQPYGGLDGQAPCFPNITFNWSSPCYVKSRLFLQTVGSTVSLVVAFTSEPSFIPGFSPTGCGASFPQPCTIARWRLFPQPDNPIDLWGVDRLTFDRLDREHARATATCRRRRDPGVPPLDVKVSQLLTAPAR